MSKTDLSGNAELHLFNAFTMKPVDFQMGITDPLQGFTVNKEGSTVVKWKISVPEGLQAVVYRVSASALSFTDGEEAPLPVLSNRMLVTESLPLPIRGNTSKSFVFKNLKKSAQSTTLRNYRLTLEYTSNPAWYAVQALPFLMEFPHECTEQLFSRFYANTLAGYITLFTNPAVLKKVLMIRFIWIFSSSTMTAPRMRI